MARIKVQPIHDVVAKVRSDDVFGTACLASLYYPTHDPDYYMKIPVKRLRTMIRVAEQHEAIKYLNLLQIRSVGLDKLSEKAIDTVRAHYQELANG